MSQVRIIWQPLEGSQSLALSCPCNKILYEGTRGPGKTDAQLLYFKQLVGRGYGPYLRGIIFDREYKMLDDLISKSKRWFPKFNDGAKFNSSKSDYKWTWPDGEELLFRQIKKSSDYWNYHGQEFPFIGWNELTKYPTSELYDMMMSCNRTAFNPDIHSPFDEKTKIMRRVPPMPLVVFATTNPYGAGHNWVKQEFIDKADPGVVVRQTTRVFNPRTQQEEDVTKTQVRIFGSYKENIYLTPEYVAELVNIKDENKRKAWLEGDWNIVAGGALDGVWTDKAKLPRFKIPSTWFINRSFDWGSTHPFWVGWWAEANGEEATLEDGTTFCPPAGTLILIHEWYGTENIGTNRGLMKSAPDIAIGIKEREAAMLADGWISKKPSPGPADNQIRDIREKDVDSIEKKMADKGIRWTKSDKSPGSRKNGLQLVRDRLEATGANSEDPQLYFMEHCRGVLITLPILPRDEDKPDDVDTDAEDHPYDGVRYRILAGGNRYATSVTIKHAT